VAQDVKTAMAAAGHAFGGVEEDAEGNLEVSPSDMLAVLWRAVQELSAHIEKLEARPG
jgi:hypothetical protein